jgi:hypothetical protein
LASLIFLGGKLGWGDMSAVAQTSKSAVSRVSKPADTSTPSTLPTLSGTADLEIGDTAGLETCATGFRHQKMNSKERRS